MIPRLLLCYALLCPEVTDADTATVRVTATIASWATVVVDADCAYLEANDPDAMAWANDVRLVANDPWVCFPTSGEMLAEAP